MISAKPQMTVVVEITTTSFRLLLFLPLTGDNVGREVGFVGLEVGIDVGEHS
jgi:hypothetical protein